jgi:hypothetical protein
MIEPSPAPKNERRLIDWLIALFCIALAILLFFFVRQYQTLRRESLISAREMSLMTAIKDHVHPTVNDANVIRSWMTFDYINKLFTLPPNYLKNQLNISNPAYPKLTIGAFNKSIHANASSTLSNVENAVRQYLINTAPTSTTTASST